MHRSLLVVLPVPQTLPVKFFNSEPVSSHVYVSPSLSLTFGFLFLTLLGLGLLERQTDYTSAGSASYLHKRSLLTHKTRVPTPP